MDKIAHSAIGRLDDRRPHVTIQTRDGDIYVVPVSLLEDVAAGRSVLETKLVERIVEEWLDNLHLAGLAPHLTPASPHGSVAPAVADTGHLEEDE